MNTFKKGDLVKNEGKHHLVSYISGPFVNFNSGRCAHYIDCQLVKPKFKPGDKVKTTTNHVRTIESVTTGMSRLAYNYVYGGWDYETDIRHAPETLGDILDRALPVRTVRSELNAGRLINAIKLYREKFGVGLKEAKEAVEAMRDSKFKIGDRVRYTVDGDTGFISDIDPWDGRIQAKWDNSPSLSYLDPNGFSLIPTTVAIVARKNGNLYEPSSCPVLHASAEAAVKEAERLAKLNPGVEFGTFVLAHKSTATAPTVNTVAA